jgi:3-dehydroquinate synthase
VTGFMGTGKTSAARRAAQLLAMPCVSTDDVVADRAGATVQDIFGRDGEAAFRQLERRAVLEAAGASNVVIETGGGAALDADAFGLLSRDATVAVLTCGPEEILRRLGPDATAGGRPLLAGGDLDRIRELLGERDEAYARAGTPLDTTGSSPEEVAAALAERHRSAGRAEAFASIEVGVSEHGYEVVIGAGQAASLGQRVRDAVPGASRAVIVCDRSITSIARAAADSLAAAGLHVESPARAPDGLIDSTTVAVSIPSGEAAKRIDTVERLWNAFAERRVGRTDVVVAIGGGTTTDVAGFAAATYGRGTPLVNVPTTLLGMVDAAIGGKTGIDHGGVKNAVGAFHHPKLVICDPELLATLPKAVAREGVAEIAKAALVASPLTFWLLERPDQVSDEPTRRWEWFVEQAVRIKAAFVAADPEDAGVRHALNLGHTYAHGIESASDYRVSHGDAVAIGLVAAARLGEDLGVTDPETARRLERLLGSFDLPVSVPSDLDPRRIADAMGSDKKRRAGRGVFVVPTPDGAALADGVDQDQAMRALMEVTPT